MWAGGPAGPSDSINSSARVRGREKEKCWSSWPSWPTKTHFKKKGTIYELTLILFIIHLASHN